MAKTFWLNQKFNINLPIWTLSAIAVKPPTLGGGYKATHTL